MNNFKPEIIQTSSIKNGYANWAKTYDNEPTVLILLDELYKRRRENILKNLHQREATLDLCCGTGRHISFLEQHFNYVAGVDFSPDMLRLAAKKVKKSSTELFCRSVFGDRLNCKFDFVNFSLAMKYFREPSRIIRLIWDYLKPNGMVDITDGTDDVLNHSEGPRYHKNGKIYVLPHRKYSTSEVLTAFKRGGFEIIESGDVLFEPKLVHLSQKLSRYHDIKCLYYITAKKI